MKVSQIWLLLLVQSVLFACHHPSTHYPPGQWGRGRPNNDVRISKGVIKVLLLFHPSHVLLPSYPGEVRGLLRKSVGSCCLRELSERKTARSKVTRTLRCRDWRDCQRARARRPGGSHRGEPETVRRILPSGPWSPDAGRTRSSWRFTQGTQSLLKLEPTG